MPAERPGTLPGRSSCVPCGRSRRQISPGDAPMHHSPTRSLSTIEPGGFADADPRAISGRHAKERVGGGGAKVESACDKGSSLICGSGGPDARPSCRPRPIYKQKNRAVGREAGAGDSPCCLVEGDVRHRHQLPALGRLSGALPLVLERSSLGVGIVEIPALFALGGIGGIAGGGGGHWSSQHTDHHTQGTQHQHYSTHLLLLPVLEGSGRPLPFLSYAFTRWSLGYVTKAAYSCLRGVYVRYGTKYVRAPRKRPNFGELRVCELRRMPKRRSS